ncbi:HdeD family acid-resistance protein [Ramlibacter sp. H39-3-26]|uniref:HdeD family acid-resistance protein n=1 Tax=Curvibacter soli TaxID=3031331 RepID=UPI0023DC4F41|nr:HdeD family acid-resistance protein [Ramlibacter sp. H39-3-26]MDF1485852.1 HdeD family acid-resistance protein [Ramlibacter sp. H39-3-26]
MMMTTNELQQGPWDTLERQWGWIALRGAAAVVFGALAFAWPGATLAALVIVWGAYALVDGVLSLAAGLRIRDNGRPLWALVAVGLLGIAAGVITFLWPGLTAITLVLVLAVWAVAAGVFQIAAAIALRRKIAGEWLQALSGLLSIVFGVLVLLQPAVGAVVLAWIVGSYAIVFGALLIGLALRLRKRRQVHVKTR